MKKSIIFSELYIVSMHNPHDGPRVPVKPWEGMDSLFLAEDCSRFTFVMNKNEFFRLPPEIEQIAVKHLETPPPKNSHPVKIERGVRAYEQLLRLAVGLEDADNRNAAVSKYVLPQWKVFKEKHPERAEEFEKIIRNISSDCTIINKNTGITQIARPTLDLAAKRLMGLHNGLTTKARVTKKQDILVVADKAPITQELVKYLTQSAAVGTVYLTHPDPVELDARLHEIQELVAGKQFSLRAARVEKIPFTQAMDTDAFNHIVICTPIGAYPEQDQAIIDAWKARTREDGFMVHRKGNPAARQTTTPPYSTANLKNFIGVEQLDAEIPRILADSDRELQEAGKIARNRAANRFSAPAMSLPDDPIPSGRGRRHG
jgi:hypothetical protein